MTWTAYCVSFQLLSPVHVGWRKLGNLQQTRPYVTGRSLWGALTARLTRENRNGAPDDYRNIGSRVDEQLAFTYFYPSTKEDKDSLWPWGEGWDKFAWTFLGSYASTALEDGRSAEEGSLHETEFIAPYTRNNEQVYLVGYIFEKENGNDKDKLEWRSVLDKLLLGGERSYGWGRVRLRGQCEVVKDKKCFGYEVVCELDRPQIKVPEGSRLLAHTGANGVNSTGMIEPFRGRETRGAAGYGGSFSESEICWIPGSKVSRDERFQIMAKGIWEQLPIKSSE